MPRLRRDDEARRHAATATITEHGSPTKNDAEKPPTRSGPTADVFFSAADASRKMSSFASAVLAVARGKTKPAAAVSRCGTKRAFGAFSVRVRVRV